jgi:hypothetical protein
LRSLLPRLKTILNSEYCAEKHPQTRHEFALPNKGCYVTILSAMLRLCLLACTILPVRVTAGDLVFAQNFLTGSKQIVTYPVGDPTHMTVVGPLLDSLAGMDFDPGAHVLWAIDITTQTLGTIDQQTGVYAPTVALQGDCCVNAFSIDPVSGIFYVSRSNEFVYTLDPASGESVLVAAGAPAGTQITALAIDCAGRFYAITGIANSGSMYQVHLDAAPTFVGSPAYASATSLEFDNDTGALYGWFNASGDDTSTHGVVDAATAQVSQTALVEGKYRMAIRNTCFRIFTDDFEA